MDPFGRLKYIASAKLHPLLELIRPLKDTSQDRQKPMQVLALGLSKCGTDSLRFALEELGYTRCYHGYVCQMESRSDVITWARLMARKFSQKPKPGKIIPEPVAVSTAEFDRVLWDCTAVADEPAAIFGPELIRAYPEAKVILNQRNDINAWEKSFKTSILTLVKMIGWLMHFFSWFDSEAFWVTRVHLWMSDDYFKCDFDKYGKQTYKEHYDRLRDMLEPGSYLEWTVQDGWEPLCKFLGKPVPAHEFPDVNKVTDWEMKVRWNSRRMIRNALRKFLRVFAISTISAVLLVLYRRSKK